MSLGKAGYYADFFVYPLFVLALAVWALGTTTAQQPVVWVLACLIGIGTWTLVEYAIHRFIFHRMPVFTRMHEMHHESPLALVGTPTWISLAVSIGVFIPLWREARFDVASGMMSGLVLGYLWYVVLDHAVHHWHMRHGSYLYRAKRRHAQHHYARRHCNFGVTTDFWDRVFGTDFRR